MADQKMCEGLSVSCFCIRTSRQRGILVAGAWRLLTSSFNKTIKGKSDWIDAKDIGVIFQKDCRVGSVVNNRISLDRYDEFDIWFLRILRGRVTKYDGTVALLPGGRVFKMISVVVVFFLLSLALVSCLLYRKSSIQLNPPNNMEA